MTTALYEAPSAGTTTRGQGPCSLFAAWLRRLARAQRMRAELNSLTDVELKDIGLTRCQIGAVVNGTFSR
jgi:uncharacterized protein YjiS (DUF1127 family)